MPRTARPPFSASTTTPLVSLSSVYSMPRVCTAAALSEMPPAVLTEKRTNRIWCGGVVSYVHPARSALHSPPAPPPAPLKFVRTRELLLDDPVQLPGADAVVSLGIPSCVHEEVCPEVPADV